jgi:hypothetical protein
LVDVAATIDAEVDDDPWGQVLRYAAPPLGERGTVKVGIEG